MFNKFFRFIFKNKIHTLFAHNLGAFDGYFIFKALANYLGDKAVNIEAIIDKQNKFITISYDRSKTRFTFKDSYRLFKLSLNDLCKLFDIKGKLSEYKTEYNSKELFKNEDLYLEFKSYAFQDSLILYQALVNAQKIYLDKYSIDISQEYSSSSLSFKI